MKNTQIVSIIWKKPHNNAGAAYVRKLGTLLDHFIHRYEKRLHIKNILISLEIPKNAAGYFNNIFIVKLHVALITGKILIVESNKRDIVEAMKDIIRKIDNRSRSTDRQKHVDNRVTENLSLDFQ